MTKTNYRLPMLVTETSIPDVKIIEPKVFGGESGFFSQSLNQNAFEEVTGLSPAFVQDNQSKSTKGVLRGLHYQLPPKVKGKLVRLVQGEVFDVAVDIRKSSPTFVQWVREILSEKKKATLDTRRVRIWLHNVVENGWVSLQND